MTRLLAAVRDAGQPLSCLYPFRESFYERLGYVTFPLPRTARLTPLSLLPLLEQDLGGQVDLVLIGDGYDAYRDYLHAVRQRTHGMAIFDHPDRFSVQRNTLLAGAGQGRRPGRRRDALRSQGPGCQPSSPCVPSASTTTPARANTCCSSGSPATPTRRTQVEISLAPFELPETWLADIKVATESDNPCPDGACRRRGQARRDAHRTRPLHRAHRRSTLPLERKGLAVRDGRRAAPGQRRRRERGRL